MELTIENVEMAILDCLFKGGEDESKAVLAEGVIQQFDFHPERLNEWKDSIIEMLNQLPETFRQNSGGGWSFLQACYRKDGTQWTDFHKDMEELFCLGIAIGKVKSQLPKEMWQVLPGGVPYYVIIE